MLIANPIYDAVFKYLMEDERVARIIIGTIIDQEIEELHFTPRERTAQVPSLGVTVFRLDFSAVIRTSDGERKNVLIELQKADGGDDVRRFRRYLAENYHEPTGDPKDDVISLEPVLPIISVYILGEPLPGLRGYSAVQVRRHYYDAVTGERIEGRDPFVECLTHDSFVVQLSELNQRRRNRLEQLLALFEQMNLHANRHMKEFTDVLPEEFEPALRRLFNAAADTAVRAEMEVEDDVLVTWKKKERVFEQQLEDARKGEEQARKREESARKRLEQERRQKEDARKCENDARKREKAMRIVALKALMAAGLSEEEAVKRLDAGN